MDEKGFAYTEESIFFQFLFQFIETEIRFIYVIGGVDKTFPVYAFDLDDP